MSQYQLRLLGTFQLHRGKEHMAGFRSEKERALLAYLSIEASRPHSRDELAGLFWPELPDDTAHNNLRVTLHRLRSVLGETDAAYPILEVSRNTMQLNQTEQLWIDVSAFQEIISKAEQHPHEKLATCQKCMAQYSEAVMLYQGEFLQGIYPEDSLPFSEWALVKREHLHHQAVQALYVLAAYHQRRGEFDLALGFARRQLELEPWREEAHAQVMTILALRGERSAALRQYERCRQVLWEELGVEPSEEIRSLYERILASRKRRRHNLPQKTTPFFGRKSELNQVIESLVNPDCRLLTILGPGGIGKSRLAFQSAEAQFYSYLQGVVLVQLAGILTQGEMVRAIAEALEFQIHPAGDPKSQLLDYLREKEILLVLDNYEHLLGSGQDTGVSIVKETLENAPELRLLITSRQRLNLSQERIFVLQGLSYPRDTFSKEPEKYEAVQLFLHSARRTVSDFMLVKEDEPSVVRICQLLEGVPLAIELAAAWTRVMTPGQIAQEIESDLDFLANSYPDFPQRHRSMRATFEHSYHLLTSEEQQALCRLSIFPGSFDRIAAEQVAGATLAVLTSLCDRSLLEPKRINKPGSHVRYRMHELIKQFSHEKFKQDPIVVQSTKNRHCNFYMRFLGARNQNVMGGMGQNQAVEEVSSEIENVRLALEQAIDQGQLFELGRSLNILLFFYEIRGEFEEAEYLFGKIRKRMEEAIDGGMAVSKEAGYYLGRAVMYHAWYCMRLARFSQAVDLFQKGLVKSREFGDLEGYGLALNSLGVIAREQGKYQQAKGYLHEAVEVVSENEYTWTLAGALSNLGILAVLEGDLSLGLELFHKSLDLYTQFNDEWGMVRSLEGLGDIALKQGNFEMAEKFIRQCLVLRQKLGQRWRVVDSLNKLGQVAYGREQYAEAKKDYQESLVILKDLGERARLASTLARYGEVCLALAENAQASESFQASLKLAQEIGVDGTTVRALLGMAIVLAQEGEKERSVEILVSISEHPSIEHEDKIKVENLLFELQAGISSHVLQTARETGEMKAFEDLVKDILRTDS